MNTKPGTAGLFFAFAMTEPRTPRTREKLFTLLFFAAFVGVIVWVTMPPSGRDWQGPLRDPDVKELALACGTADDPPGTGMPAWPEGKQRYYTRQHWTEAGELKVEVWEFLSGGNVLVSADRQVKGRRIVIETRWEVPPGAPTPACHAKLGAEVTFRGLPRGDYVIDAR